MKFKRIQLIYNNTPLSTTITLDVVYIVHIIIHRLFALTSYYICYCADIFFVAFILFCIFLKIIFFSGRLSSCRSFYGEFVSHMVTQLNSSQSYISVHWILKLTHLSRSPAFHYHCSLLTSHSHIAYVFVHMCFNGFTFYFCVGFILTFFGALCFSLS